MSHTPGPWEIRSLFVGPLQIVAGDEIVAMVGHDTFEVCAANADLIAAAPDLLAALETFVAIDDGDEPLLWNFTENLNQMRTAIKKARG